MVRVTLTYLVSQFSRPCFLVLVFALQYHPRPFMLLVFDPDHPATSSIVFEDDILGTITDGAGDIREIDIEA